MASQAWEGNFKTSVDYEETENVFHSFSQDTAWKHQRSFFGNVTFSASETQALYGGVW